MSGVRFHIVTNDGPRAALRFACHMGNLPSWLGVIDDPQRMLALPEGAVVRCLWFGDREALAPWEGYFGIRRERGDLKWISEEDWSRIMDWCETNRGAPSRRLLLGEEGEIAGDSTPAVSPAHAETPAASPDATMNQMPESVNSPAAKRKAKWS